jgi:hypothetical protein
MAALLNCVESRDDFLLADSGIFLATDGGRVVAFRSHCVAEAECRAQGPVDIGLPVIDAQADIDVFREPRTAVRRHWLAADES